MTSDVVLVLTTVPEGERGEAIARAFVDERLAACVNLLAPMTSVYRWEGQVEREVERQVVIKTTRSQVEALRVRLASLHPYRLPEFVVLDVAGGSREYLDWVQASTGAEKPAG